MRKYTPLDCKEYEKYLQFEEPLFDGIHYLFEFKNKYQLSVVKHEFSYGNHADLFEVMVITPEGYFKDPIGYLTNDEVLEKLRDVKILKK